MTTPSNNPSTDSKKTWSRLTTEARRVMPPTDIDVRHSVRAAIEAGAANATIQIAPAGQSIMDDLAQLTQSLFTRLVLGGCAALAAFSLWSGLDTVAGLSVVADLQGGLFLSSYLTP